MCGIAGIFNFKGETECDRLTTMLDYMIHRGPDDSGVYVDQSFTMGMRRLSIIDLKSGHQPISNEDERLVIVFNGEIYNYIELREELLSTGHQFKTNSDTEVILHLYEEYGYDCITYLNGIFSFSIWDRHTQKLFIARDRLGIKPLFYFDTTERFVYSSELRSISKAFSMQKISQKAFINYMLMMYVPDPLSMIDGVNKLEAGTYLVVDAKNKITKHKYWDINEVVFEKTDPSQYRAKLEDLLNDSIKLQMRSDVEIGTFLSGGLDSSFIVAAISRLSDKPVNTFSIGYENLGYDERPLARLVAKKFKTNHKEMFINADTVKDNLKRICAKMDEPIGDTAAIPTFLLSELARSNNVKVILNGTGGDEIFGGYVRYIPISIKQRILKTFPMFLRKFLALITYPINKTVSYRFANRAYNYFFNGVRIEFLTGLFGINKVDDFMRELKNIYIYSSRAHIPEMNIDLKNYLVGDLLFMLDKMTMGTSIEGRVPFLDHRLVEYMYSLPRNQKIVGKQTKVLFREILRSILPKELLNVPKRGFGAPYKYWVTDVLLEEIKVAIRDVKEADILSFVELDEIIKGLESKSYLEKNALPIYLLYIAIVWYKEFIK